jgi:hypothetical protein
MDDSYDEIMMYLPYSIARFDIRLNVYGRQYTEPIMTFEPSAASEN